ncbi:hypothetical protein GCM10009579_65890 [Streptomyces javensis]|uniref:Uncharacterized protein n=1 Tax=Streptomyces javensis TaxID=114698 RepID=A0ABN1X894_9ACTN
MDRMLKGNTSAEVINAVKVSGKTAPKGGELNEHVRYDFPSVAKVADRIAAALGKAAPDDAATFTKNAEAFKEKVKPLQAKEAEIKKKHGGEGVAITEPVPLYLTEACGLANKTPRSSARPSRRATASLRRPCGTPWRCSRTSGSRRGPSRAGPARARPNPATPARRR